MCEFNWNRGSWVGLIGLKRENPCQHTHVLFLSLWILNRKPEMKLLLGDSYWILLICLDNQTKYVNLICFTSHDRRVRFICGCSRFRNRTVSFWLNIIKKLKSKDKFDNLTSSSLVNHVFHQLDATSQV